MPSLGFDHGQAVDRILARVQRQGRIVFAEPVPIGKGSVFFLQMPAVGQ